MRREKYRCDQLGETDASPSCLPPAFHSEGSASDAAGRDVSQDLSSCRDSCQIEKDCSLDCVHPECEAVPDSHWEDDETHNMQMPRSSTRPKWRER
mmetsp:Transcript_147324/g.367332  ORF Transcript_147324/g.367332 Transcript_147324/m.367332 type:complete len:96 (-) Transcript_147324:34-321(-)